MRTAKKWLLLLLCCILLLTGCATEPEKRPSVWLIVKSTTTEFWQAAFAGAKAAKSEYDLNLTIVGPETEEDYEKQNEYIREAVEQGADAIVLSAISYTGNAKAVDDAVAAGVRVIVIDSDVDSERVSVRIGTDNVEAGRMACRAALNTEASSLNVGVINFDAGVRNGQERENGFREVLYQDPRVTQIFTVHTLTEPEEAQRQTEKLLREHPEINVLVSFNEPLSVGAARAIAAMNAQNLVRFVAFDTNLECIDYLQSGVISSLIVQNPYAMGYLGVETAWKILRGEKKATPVRIATPAVVVTQDNMFSLEQQKMLFPFD